MNTVWGGFLVYSLPRNQKVYIDGRTAVLYTADHMRRWGDAKRDSAVLREEINRYEITDVLLENVASNQALAMETGLLGLEFAEPTQLLYSTSSANLAATGLIYYQPACWNESMAGQLEREAAIIQAPGFNNQQLRVLAGFHTAFANSNDRGDFLQNFLAEAQQAVDEPVAQNSKLRFAGFRALELGLYKEAVELFALISILQPKDAYALALGLLRSGDRAQAERVTGMALNARWQWLDDLDLSIQYSLVEQVAPYETIDPSLPGWLAQQLSDAGLESIDEIGPQHFCSAKAVAGFAASNKAY